MPISVKCPDCSKGLKAPDALAGKNAKCPQCGSIVPIPTAESDAVAVVKKRKPPVAEEFDDDDGDAEDYEDTADDAADDRRPCPMCGERILATAVKCCFCGEIVDVDAAPTVRRSKKKKKSGSGDRALLVSFRRHSQWTGGFVIFIAVCVGFMALSIIGNINSKNVPGAIGAFVILAESLIIGSKGCELQRRGIPLDEIP